ncbi:hypothetical protein ACO0K2_01965 [Undibacterium sp. MH2W]|uniref:hypothetical protein n=1 Tax=Undibacterium sp. MH2W TaxID=3413044 RepID=UPI003BF015E1
MRSILGKALNNTYVVGIFFTMLSICVSLLINVILYPIYWKILTTSDFQNWFSIFEFSLLFLLLDIGFSQNFIKNNVESSAVVFEHNFHKLRGTLFIVSVFAFVVQLPVFFFIRQPENFTQFFPYFLLALSTAFTLWAYSETAALRVLLKFNSIAFISITGNLIFLILVFYFRHYGIYAIAYAVLLRALVINFLQLFILSKSVKLKMIFSLQFEGATTNALMNFSYLSIFAFDAVVFSKAGIKGSDVASYMLNRKVYDLIKGFFDAAMNVISVKLVKQKLSDHLLYVVLFLGLIFLSVYLVSPYLYRYAIGSNSFDSKLSFLLALSGFLAAITRFCQLSFYMTSQTTLILNLFAVISFLKLVSFSTLFVFHTQIPNFYFLQCGFMLLLILFTYLNNRKKALI